MSALGHKRTFLDVRFSQNDVRFTPESGHCAALANVRFVPEADIASFSGSLSRNYSRFDG